MGKAFLVYHEPEQDAIVAKPEVQSLPSLQSSPKGYRLGEQLLLQCLNGRFGLVDWGWGAPGTFRALDQLSLGFDSRLVHDEHDRRAAFVHVFVDAYQYIGGILGEISAREADSGFLMTTGLAHEIQTDEGIVRKSLGNN